MEKRKEREEKQVAHAAAGDRASTEEVKLASIAISFDIRLRSADMPAEMQERALRYARLLVDSAAGDHRPNPTLLARSLKKVGPLFPPTSIHFKFFSSAYRQPITDLIT
ncbi:hypothetical protein U1Q18_000663 [Sarracenia purpurea var. burkii]